MSSDVIVHTSFQLMYRFYGEIISYCIDTNNDIQKIYEEMRLCQAFLAFQSDPKDKKNSLYRRIEYLYEIFKDSIKLMGPNVLYHLLEQQVDGRVIGFVASYDKYLIYRRSDNGSRQNLVEAAFHALNPMALNCLLQCESEEKERASLATRLQVDLMLLETYDQRKVAVEMAAILLNHRADVTEFSNKHKKSCFLPATQGDYELLDLYLKTGLNPNFEKGDCTLLGDVMSGYYKTTDKKYEKCADLLFKAGAKVSLLKPMCQSSLSTSQNEFCYKIFLDGINKEPDQAVKIFFVALESGLYSEQMLELIKLCPQITQKTIGGTKNQELMKYSNCTESIWEAVHYRESLTQLEMWKKDLSGALNESPQKGIVVIFEAAKSGLHHKILVDLIIKCPLFKRTSVDNNGNDIFFYYKHKDKKIINEMNLNIQRREDFTTMEIIKKGFDKSDFPPDVDFC